MDNNARLFTQTFKRNSCFYIAPLLLETYNLKWVKYIIFYFCELVWTTIILFWFSYQVVISRFSVVMFEDNWTVWKVSDHKLSRDNWMFL